MQGCGCNRIANAGPLDGVRASGQKNHGAIPHPRGTDLDKGLRHSKSLSGRCSSGDPPVIRNLLVIQLPDALFAPSVLPRIGSVALLAFARLATSAYSAQPPLQGVIK